MTRELATRFGTPRERLLGVFEVQGLSFAEPGFRGCAFVGANAEASPGSGIEEVTEDYRTRLRSLFLDLARQAGAADPDHLAQRLVLLYNGAGIPAWMDHDASTAQAARAIAETLVEAAIPPEATSPPAAATGP
jgi:hypothetical protein